MIRAAATRSNSSVIWSRYVLVGVRCMSPSAPRPRRRVRIRRVRGRGGRLLGHHRDGRGRYEENHRDGRGYDRDYRGGRDDYRGWQSINQRQAHLDRRIDQGVRNGQLSRREAVRLRAEFNQIARLEARYRRDGLSQWERADLDRRFDRLSAQIRYERRDRDGRRW